MEKDPEKRLSDVEILNHPWSRTYFHSQRNVPYILSYPESDFKSDVIDSPAKEDRPSDTSTQQHLDISPKESTMIPFMAEIYQKELESDLTKAGIINEWNFEENAGK